MSITVADTTINRESILALLRAEGYRVTQPRIAIIDAALNTPTGFTADEMYDRLKGVAGIGRATVFRTCDTLVRLGYLRRLHGEASCHQFIRATPGHHHHLICTQCRQVLEFDGCTVAALAEDLAARTHFRIAGHQLEMFGLCPDCQTT